MFKFYRCFQLWPASWIGRREWVGAQDMRVVHAIRFGQPDALVASQVPDLVAGPAEVVVKVVVAPLLFLDTQVRSGQAEWFSATPPYVPGVGVAGYVSSVGTGVSPAWIGRRVVADTAQGGGYAEQALALVRGLVTVPEGLSLPEAAALLHDGRTALRLADVAKIHAGEWVLVTAAAGGLGSLLVQLAHAAGASVVAAARGKRKLDLARGLGADVSIDYSEPSWPQRVRDATDGHGVDVVFDGAGGHIGQAAFGVTADHARFFAYGAPGGGFAELDRHEADRRDVTVLGIEQVQFEAAEAKQLTERALAEAIVGRMKPVIGQTFPLDRATDAHAAIEARTVLGKTLLVI